MITYEALVTSLLVEDLPQLEPVNHMTLSDADVLIACVGFEERSLASLDLARIGRSDGFKLLAVEYVPEIPENHRARFYALANLMRSDICSVLYDRQRPEGGGAQIVKGLPSGGGYIILDISGMSRLLIVQSIVEFAKRGLLSRVKVLYTEAEFYSPSVEEFDSFSKSNDEGSLLDLAMMVSVGVFGLTIVPELSSVSMAGSPMHVVIFPSWNSAQLAAVRSELQATYYTVFIPLSPNKDNEWKTKAVQTISRVDLLGSGVRTQRFVPVLDVQNVLRLLVRLYTEVSHQEKLVIAPTGSKIQSVCVGVFRAMFSDVQIVYPTPRAFAKPREYTRGAKQSYLLDLSFFARLVRTDQDDLDCEQDEV